MAKFAALADGVIPTVSEWGMIVMALPLPVGAMALPLPVGAMALPLPVGAKVCFNRRRPARA